MDLRIDAHQHVERIAVAQWHLHMHTPVLLFALLPNKGPGMAACLAQHGQHLRKVKVGGGKQGLTLWRLDSHNQIRAVL
ncbi:hypothetical protein FZN37_004429 [Enterobacter hormaechei]|nr:hypothetical protein FZN37_004429 [Enterobacter hormaechei]